MRPDLTIDAADLSAAGTARIFEQSGCLKLANFIDPAKIEALKNAALAAVRVGDAVAIQVGDARRMVPVPISGILGCTELYAPARLRDHFSMVLGEKFVLNCFTLVSAEPGAPDQHVHRDYEGLFADKIDSFCPSFAVNLFIPLVPFNSLNGTTRVWPGSHRRPDTSIDDPADGYVDPEVEPGAALLVDYRLRHSGTANKSDSDRPALCLGYSRDWFLDTRNFGAVGPLQVEAETLEQMDEADRRLFVRAIACRKSGFV